MFQAILFFDPKWLFCMGDSLCLLAICGHFQNALIFRILAAFGAVFCIEQLECVCRNVFRMFLAYLIFNPNYPFCMGYSLCLLAICGHFQNALIFRILAVFRTVFCIEQLKCVCRNVFCMPLHCGHFWPFSKCSHFSNISCFFEPFFSYNNLNVL